MEDLLFQSSDSEYDSEDDTDFEDDDDDDSDASDDDDDDDDAGEEDGGTDEQLKKQRRRRRRRRRRRERPLPWYEHPVADFIGNGIALFLLGFLGWSWLESRGYHLGPYLEPWVEIVSPLWRNPVVEPIATPAV